MNNKANRRKEKPQSHPARPGSLTQPDAELPAPCLYVDSGIPYAFQHLCGH